MPTSLQRAPVRAVLTDFDRTLTLLFDDKTMRVVTADLAAFYAARCVPVHLLRAANAYTLWIDAYKWMSRHAWAHVDAINQGATDLLGEHEHWTAQETRLFNGVRSVLEWLDDLRIPVAVVSTNATTAVGMALKENEVDHLVSVVLGRDQRVDMGRLKPDPSPVREALEQVGGGPAVLVGDDVSDMVAGKRAEVPTVGVTTGGCSAQELTAAGATVVIPSFGELPRVVGAAR